MGLVSCSLTVECIAFSIRFRHLYTICEEKRGREGGGMG